MTGEERTILKRLVHEAVRRNVGRPVISAKGTGPRICVNGHEVTEDNGYRTSDGYLSCRVCRDAARKRSKERKLRRAA